MPSAQVPVRSAGGVLAAGLVFAAMAMSCVGCGPARRVQITYRVALPDPSTGHAEVTARFAGIRGDSLTLAALGESASLDLSIIEASAGGHRLPMRIWSEIAPVGSRSVDLPRVTLSTGTRSDVVLRYRVALGRAVGNDHVGRTGARDGYCGADFALVSGRNLFLLPLDAANVRDIQVRFQLPPEWTAVTPWGWDRDSFRPGVAGRLAAEHLVTAAIGMGRFRITSTRVGGTEHRFAVEQSITKSTESLALRSMTKVARYCGDLFRRDLGPTFLTVIVPEVDGDEIQVESWSTGQGITGGPFTASALHQFALGILRAYMQYAPFRSEVSNRRDYWLATAVPELFAWKALVQAGWMDDSERVREMGVAYLANIRVRGVEANLEQLYDTKLQSRQGRSSLGPFVLEALDQEVRRSSAGTSTLESLLTKAFPEGRSRSLWSLLPGGTGQWREFRARYVRGAEPLPAAALAGMTSPKDRPERATGAARNHLMLLVSGGTYGFLETCGCKSNQSGGAARRATLLQRLRAEHPNLVWLDAGDTFTRAETGEPPDSLERSEQRLHLRLLTQGGCSVSAVGPTELQFGVPFFRSVSAAAGFPYLAANLSEEGQSLGPARRIITAAGKRLGVIGVFDPPTPMLGSARLQRTLAHLSVEDPVAALRRETANLRPHVDLVVAIGRLTPLTLRRLAREVPELDIAISTENAGPNPVGATSGPTARQDPAGFHGSLLCLYTAPVNYGLIGVELGLDDSTRIASVDFKVHMLSPTVPDDPDVRAQLDRFYERIGRVEPTATALFADDRQRMEARYAGAERCATCHRDAWQQWRSTRHANAFKTLLERHRNAHPGCVACHVVGYGTRHGYRLGDREAPLGGVQCEVCHGPGADHADHPTRDSIRRHVGAEVCLQCHTPDHSDHFDYAERLPKVMHSNTMSSHEPGDRETPGLWAAAAAMARSLAAGRHRLRH